MLVNCVAYQEGKKLADIAVEDIRRHVSRRECFVWVALKDPEPAMLADMQENFDLHELAVEDAQHGHERPKIEEYGDSLFAVLHTVEMAGLELTVGEVDIFVGRNYVLSVRSRTERGFKEVRARVEREPELLQAGSGYVLYALMDAIVDRYFPVLDAIESELERIEERLFQEASSPRDNIEALYYVKQQLTMLRHASGPAQEHAGKLFGGRVPLACHGLTEYFRDVYDHLARINQAIDAARETANTAIQVALAMVNMGHGEITKRLAAYAALVAVPTMIAGVYGMNFEVMPELKWTFGYPLSVIAMLVIDGVLFFRFRKAGWI